MISGHPNSEWFHHSIVLIPFLTPVIITKPLSIDGIHSICCFLSSCIIRHVVLFLIQGDEGEEYRVYKETILESLGLHSQKVKSLNSEWFSTFQSHSLKKLALDFRAWKIISLLKGKWEKQYYSSYRFIMRIKCSNPYKTLKRLLGKIKCSYMLVSVTY